MEEEILDICDVCKSIKIDDGLWLDKEIDSRLYDKFIKKYESKLSHGYCPPCYEVALNQLE